MVNPKIIVIGSGWGSASFIKNIDKKYNITVISPTNNFIYTPLLVNSLFNVNLKLEIPINMINPNIKCIKNKVSNIDFNNNQINFDKETLKYDYLILSHGSNTNTFNIKGVNENCEFIQNIDNINLIRDKINKLKSDSNIAIIGCGPTGSEIIGNLIDENIYNEKKYNIYAIDGLSNPLNMYHKNIQDYTLKLWKENNVNIIMNQFVSSMDNKNINFKDSIINYDMAFWCGGIKKNKLTETILKDLNIENKFGIPVDNKLKIKSDNINNVYAIGDCSYSGNPPTAQVSYQQGKYLAKQFNYDLNLNDNFKYKPKGQICYIGNGNSVYDYKNIIYFKGKLTGYLNNFIHIYNCINNKQRYNFSKYL